VSLNWIVSWLPKTAFTPRVGDLVRVSRRGRSPLAGSHGTVVRITEQDPYGPFLVEFPNGLRFRYRTNEIVAFPQGSDAFLTTSSEHRAHGILQEPPNRVEDVGGFEGQRQS